MKISNRNILINLIDNQNIKPQNIPKALKELQIIPTAKSWHNFIDKLLLWFGALSLAFAVLFFVAYNWSELGRFGKFALVEGLLIISIGVYLFTTSGTDGFSLAFFGTLVPCTLFEKVSDSEELLSKVTLMVSSLLVGTLLALVGQIYQTGADSWELFFYWALLILPWVFISRFWAMWIFWIGLIDLSILLYMDTFSRHFLFYFLDFTPILVMFMFNTTALVIWEYFRGYLKWLDNSWGIGILGIVSMITATALAIDSTALLPIWIVWLFMFYYFYRVRSINIFMLSLAFSSLYIVILYYLIESISWRYFNLLNLFLVSIVGIGLGTAFLAWLKSIYKELSNESN